MDEAGDTLHVSVTQPRQELVFNKVHLTSFQLIRREIFVDHVYTPDDRFLIHPGETVVDIGANIGMFTVYAASLHPSVRVLAVEPARDNYEALCENLRINNLSNVRTYHGAVAARSESKVVLYRDRAGGCHSLLRDTPTRLLGLTHITGMEDVESRTLDALFEDFAIDVCDLLKVDCEGGEHSFLPSCAPVTLQRIRRIALEYHDLVDGQTERGLKPFLERHGFIVDALRRDMSKKENVGMLYGIRAQ